MEETLSTRKRGKKLALNAEDIIKAMYYSEHQCRTRQRRYKNLRARAGFINETYLLLHE